MRHLITSALPYINGIKHLGNLAGSMLPADVHARFLRAQGKEVVFICATDEHGTPAELAAAEAGQSVAEYCTEQHQIQGDIYKAFNLSFDGFGRTSAPENKELTQHFCRQLEKNGYITEKSTKQVYAVDDKRFLPDRYVEGTCPKCGYANARGDQCDSCGTLLDPVDLINPRSKITGSTNIELRDTAHLFLQQPLLAGEVEKWVDVSTGWSPLTTSIARKWLNEGLQERSITRDLEWGVKVTDVDGNPRQGFEDKVFYVWFDAPIGYIGATQEWATATGNDWQSWWRLDHGAKDVEYIQFMGKDNVAFHTVSFPVTILGSGEPWKLVDRIKAFNWVNWYGDKFSTSQKRGVFMDQALELLPPDYWRWYLMVNAPEGNDFAFTWETFQATINGDLGNTLGNLVNRIAKFCESKFDGVIPDGGTDGPLEEQLYKDVAEKMAALTQHHADINIRKAALETRALWVLGNEYLAQAAPWTTIKADPAQAAVAVRTALNLCVMLAVISEPYIPATSRTILSHLGFNDLPYGWPTGDIKALLQTLAPGTTITAPPVLFTRIEDEWVKEQAVRFGGAQ
ncbi:MAG: methionine--tRNA ligase [Pseudomonadota bacterium]